MHTKQTKFNILFKELNDYLISKSQSNFVWLTSKNFFYTRNINLTLRHQASIIIKLQKLVFFIRLKYWMEYLAINQKTISVKDLFIFPYDWAKT